VEFIARRDQELAEAAERRAQQAGSTRELLANRLRQEAAARSAPSPSPAPGSSNPTQFVDEYARAESAQLMAELAALRLRLNSLLTP
jgi:hypothetical protein